MTVKELKKALKKYDNDLEVRIVFVPNIDKDFHELQIGKWQENPTEWMYVAGLLDDFFG